MWSPVSHPQLTPALQVLLSGSSSCRPWLQGEGGRAPTMLLHRTQDPRCRGFPAEAFGCWCPNQPWTFSMVNRYRILPRFLNCKISPWPCLSEATIPTLQRLINEIDGPGQVWPDWRPSILTSHVIQNISKCDRVTCVWAWIHNDIATPLQTLGFSQSIAPQFNFKWPASDGIATLLRWRTRLTGIYLLTLPHVTANLDEFWFHSSFQDSWPFHLEPSYGDALAYLTGSTIAWYCQSWISERMPWWVLWTYRC